MLEAFNIFVYVALGIFFVIIMCLTKMLHMQQKWIGKLDKKNNELLSKNELFSHIIGFELYLKNKYSLKTNSDTNCNNDV